MKPINYTWSWSVKTVGTTLNFRYAHSSPS
jgi:hypothetical protein